MRVPALLLLLALAAVARPRRRVAGGRLGGADPGGAGGDGGRPPSTASSPTSWRGPAFPGWPSPSSQDGKVLLAKGYGVREVGKPEPVDPATVFQLASVSKSVAATVVATEVAAGRVAWDTPMATLLPWFALSDPRASALVTVGDLFAHRSGLPDHAGDRARGPRLRPPRRARAPAPPAARRLPRQLRLHQLRPDRRGRGRRHRGGQGLGDAVRGGDLPARSA